MVTRGDMRTQGMGGRLPGWQRWQHARTLYLYSVIWNVASQNILSASIFIIFSLQGHTICNAFITGRHVIEAAVCSIFTVVPGHFSIIDRRYFTVRFASCPEGNNDFHLLMQSRSVYSRSTICIPTHLVSLFNSSAMLRKDGGFL